MEEHYFKLNKIGDWRRGFIVLLPQAVILPGSDAGVIVLSQHRVLLSKTVRSRAPCGADVKDTLLGCDPWFVH